VRFAAWFPREKDEKDDEDDDEGDDEDGSTGGTVGEVVAGGRRTAELSEEEEEVSDRTELGELPSPCRDEEDLACENDDR
jgi:hypothetical protein